MKDGCFFVELDGVEFGDEICMGEVSFVIFRVFVYLVVCECFVEF